MFIAVFDKSNSMPYDGESTWNKKTLQEGIKGFRNIFFFKGFPLSHIKRKLTTNMRKKL